MTERKFAFGDFLDDPTIMIVGGQNVIEGPTPRQKRYEEERWYCCIS
jgi:predicted metalloenzyme YecM